MGRGEKRKGKRVSTKKPGTAKSDKDAEGVKKAFGQFIMTIDDDENSHGLMTKEVVDTDSGGENDDGFEIDGSARLDLDILSSNTEAAPHQSDAHRKPRVTVEELVKQIKEETVEEQQGDLSDDDEDASVKSEEEGDQEEEGEEEDEHPEMNTAKGNDRRTSGYIRQDCNFEDFGLEKNTMKAIFELKYEHPTEIQAAAIPHILNSRDVLGRSVTGTGKTAAFLIPIIHKISKYYQAQSLTRALIICPTRELASQCHDMCQKLAKYSNISMMLSVGGLSMKKQAEELREKPEIIIATPGRIIDHIRNTMGVDLTNLDYLVLDEADRLLDLGFKDELKEIVRHCPMSRQTLLFSATLSTDLEEMASLSLKDAANIEADKLSVPQTLEQQFIRVKDESMRMAHLLALCRRSFQKNAIVFFSKKADAHKARVMFALLGMKAAELHGSLKQDVRMSYLEEFKNGSVDFLLTTDVASRGLDIDRARIVINYELPTTVTNYIHRVGRTARMASGTAISLVGESEIGKLKDIIGSLIEKPKERIIPEEVLETMAGALKRREKVIADVLKREKEEDLVEKAEEEISRASNRMKYEKEIMARPKRTWFQSREKKGRVVLEGRKKFSKDWASRDQDRRRKKKMSSDDIRKDFALQRKSKALLKKNGTRKGPKESMRSKGSKGSRGDGGSERSGSTPVRKRKYSTDKKFKSKKKFKRR